MQSILSRFYWLTPKFIAKAFVMDFSAVFGHAQYDGDHKKQTYHEVISILFFCPNI